ncbi:MAG: hypothetical protein LBT42_05795 [Tannerella sp.]|jgi:hypothetical protein|nr:hypothetical protein [Tannerella sp.]
MNTFKKYLLLFCLALPGIWMHAQKDLSIKTVFDDYGKQEGSVMIELAKDVLSDNTKISHYKSLITSSDSKTVKAIEEAVQKDLEGGSILLESKKDGQMETACYCLKKESNSPVYEYILFKNKSGKITLLYVKGYFPPQDLEQELGELKGLFIKINNNKKIKF